MFIQGITGHRETDASDVLRILGLDSLVGLDAYVAFERMLEQFRDEDVRSYDMYVVYLDDVYAYALKHEMGA
jgi:hypothetical protein